MVISKTLTPGLPSGVSLAASSRSTPASTLHPITEVAKPVSLSEAARTQREDAAVMITRATRMVKASANVSSMKTSRILMSEREGGIADPPDRVVLECNRRVRVKVPLQIGQHRCVEAWLQSQTTASRCPPQLPFLHQQLSCFEDIPWSCEHLCDVIVLRVDRNVRVRAGPQVAFVSKTEQTGRARPGDDRDLVQGILARQTISERRAGQQLRIDLLEPLVSHASVHQQLDQCRIGEECPAIGMVGREYYPPRI